MAEAELVAEIITWVLCIGFVVAVVVLDLLRNPLGHIKKYCRFRTINWLICGLTYAFAYMGRYNISVANVQSMWDTFNVAQSYGTILLVGNIAYAIFVITNGYIVDMIGARMGMCIGALGSAFSNFIMGCVCAAPDLQVPAAHYGIADPSQGDPDGVTFTAVMSTLYAVNNFFQTFCTSAICKLGVNWYHNKERGVFSGLFGVVISFGFFLAFQVDGMIMGDGGPVTIPWIFYTPAMVLIVFFFLNFFIVKAVPEDKFHDEEIETLRGEGYDRQTSANAPQAEERHFFSVLKPIFTQWIFLIMAICELCIGWNRDGTLNWYNSYFMSHFGEPPNSVPYTIASTGVTVGGMFGSLITGVLSDVIFHSRRPPMALVDGIALLFSFIGLWALYDDVYGSACMIFVAAIFFNGLNGIITSTAAMDFAGSGATGTAVGLLDGIQKVASALTGPLITDIVAEYDYLGWILSMIPMASLMVIFFSIIVYVVPKGYIPNKQRAKLLKPNDGKSESSLDAGSDTSDVSLTDSHAGGSHVHNGKAESDKHSSAGLSPNVSDIDDHAPLLSK